MTSNLTLSASETLGLWNTYLTETMTTHVMKYFMAKTTDEEVLKILEFALQISQEGVQMIVVELIGIVPIMIPA